MASSVEALPQFRICGHSPPVIAAYLERHGVTDEEIGGVCVAGAGPVREGVVQLTNLDWRIDRAALASVLTAE